MASGQKDNNLEANQPSPAASPDVSTSSQRASEDDLRKALKGYALTEVVKLLNANYIEQGEYTQSFLDTCVSAAEERHCHRSSDEIETDGFACLSPTENGVWVSAWLWVPNEAVGLPDPDDEDEEEPEDL